MMEIRLAWYQHFHCGDGGCSVLADDFVLDSEIAEAIRELHTLMDNPDMSAEAPFRHYQNLTNSRVSEG